MVLVELTKKRSKRCQLEMKGESCICRRAGRRGLNWSRGQEEGQEGGREKERGGTKEEVVGASNKKELRPCPNLRKPFLFAISSQGSEADIQLGLKWSEYWVLNWLNSKLARSLTR